MELPSDYRAAARNEFMNPQSRARSQYLPQLAERVGSTSRLGRAVGAAQDINKLATAYQSAGSPGKFLAKDAEFRSKMLPGLAEKYGKSGILGKAVGFAQRASETARRFGFGAMQGGGKRSRKMPRQYGPRAQARHQAMRDFAKAGYTVGDISKMAAEAVRRAEQSGSPVAEEVHRMLMQAKSGKRGGGVTMH